MVGWVEPTRSSWASAKAAAATAAKGAGAAALRRPRTSHATSQTALSATQTPWSPLNGSNTTPVTVSWACLSFPVARGASFSERR